METFKDPISYTLKGFQAAHNIGHTKYYQLKSRGLAPRETVIDGKHLIFGEDAAAWRRKMRDLSEKSVEAAAAP
jgi:hypothetical protein